MIVFIDCFKSIGLQTILRTRGKRESRKSFETYRFSLTLSEIVYNIEQSYDGKKGFVVSNPEDIDACCLTNTKYLCTEESLTLRISEISLSLYPCYHSSSTLLLLQSSCCFTSVLICFVSPCSYFEGGSISTLVYLKLYD